MGRDSFFKKNLFRNSLLGLPLLFLFAAAPEQALARFNHSSGSQHTGSSEAHTMQGRPAHEGFSGALTGSRNNDGQRHAFSDSHTNMGDRKNVSVITIAGNDISVSTLQQNTSNREVIILRGNNDTVTATQIGLYNAIKIIEVGIGDTAIVNQNGIMNVAKIMQFGNDSLGIVGQIGHNNRSSIQQIGLRETAGVGQLGHVNTSSITQLASLPVHEKPAPPAPSALQQTPSTPSGHSPYQDAPLNLLDVFFGQTAKVKVH